MKIIQYAPSEIQDQFFTLSSICWYTYCHMNGRYKWDTQFSDKKTDTTVIVTEP